MPQIPLKIWAIDLTGPIHLGFEAWALPGGEKKPEGWGVQQTLKVCDPFPKEKYQQQEKSRALVSPCKRPKCCSFCSRKGKNEWVKEQSYFARFWSTNPDKTSAGMDTQAAGWAPGEVGITQLPLKHSVTQHNGDILLLNKAIWGFFI